MQFRFRRFIPVSFRFILLFLALGAFAALHLPADDAAPANAPAVTELPAPADADARRQAFADRNNPQEIEALAKQLFAYWDFTERRPSRNPATDSLEGEKAQVVDLYKKQDYDGALKAYRTYFVHKVQRLWYTEPVGRSSFENRAASAGEKTHYDEAVDYLMKDEYHVGSTETVHIGEPGLVDWGWNSSTIQNPWDNLFKPTVEYFGDSEFNKLWWKFVDTKDPQYLDKWLAFLDDYAMNDHFQENLSALNLDLGKQGQGDTNGFFEAVLQISNATAAGGDVIPPTSLARMMIHQLEIVLPQSSFYNRQQSNNHSPGACAGALRDAEFIFDFKLAKTLEVESRRQFETYGTVEARPDGAGPGRLPEYAMFEFKENIPILGYFYQGNFDWLTPMVNRENRDRMLLRAYYMIHMTTPTGEYRVGVNTDDRRLVNYEDKITLFQQYYPELFDDPDMFRIATLTLKNIASPNWQGNIHLPPEKPLANMGLGSAKEDEPSYDSFSYPYDRINVLSNGWDPNNSEYGVLDGEAAHRGDSFMKENKATNHFGLSAFNRDIFRQGVSYAYNYLDSPMLVDQQEEFSGAGEGPTSRRGMGNFGFDPISTDRIHYSANFDVAESVYDWAYVNTGTHNPEYYDYKTKLDDLKRAIWGVSHRRVVQFVKKKGFWVVTDLMSSDKPHDYSQQWWLAEFTKEAPDGFVLDQIQADNNAQTIKSEAPNAVNFSMYHVGPADLDKNHALKLQYDPVAEKPEQIDKFSGPRSDRHEGFQYIQLRGTWKSQGGRSQLVTVVYPRKTENDKLASLTPNKEGNGFVAKLQDGTEVDYAASFGKAASLSAGGLSGVAESLLVVKEGSKTSGLVMGCSSIHGHGVQRNGADFEFDGAETSPIYRPIQPVKIEPGVDGFADKMAVTMKTDTEGTEIRYTVDGNDPTLSSHLYSGPVTFTDTVMVKARAFRKGLEKMPPLTQTGTEMTGVATAVYTKEPFHLANTDTTATQAGLAYDYYEAKWPFFIFGVNPTLTSLKSGEVSTLFDTSASGGEKKQAFAFVYHGYLDVPADGVYTIYAPSEFTEYRPLSGYDLQVKLGYQINTNNGKQTVNKNTPLETWYPATRHHAFGTWSIALQKGLQPLSVYYADMRPGARLQYQKDDYDGWNIPNLTKIVWDGTVPNLEISGPGVTRQPIPKDWLKHD
jgi:hypothetical protein